MSNIVVLVEQEALDADEICAALTEQARSKSCGSDAINTLEWKAARLIRALLVKNLEKAT